MSGDTVEVAELLSQKPMSLTEQSRMLALLSEAIDAAREGHATGIEVNGHVIAAILPWPVAQDALTEHERETLEGQMAITRAQAHEIGGILDRIEAGLDAEKLVVKLAPVLAELVRKGVIDPAEIGLPTGHVGPASIERWLRS